MAKATRIKQQKREALAAFRSSDPATVAIPTTRSVLAADKRWAPTCNQAHVAACCGLTAPDESFTLGKGWDGDHHGGLIGEAGTALTGAQLSHAAVYSEVRLGLCAGREFLGNYKHEYMVGDLLVLRHGRRDEKYFAARAISAYLALDFLLTVPKTGEVIEIGGRATGGPNVYSAIIQRLWVHKEVRVPVTDAAIACHMFGELTWEERGMLPGFPGSVSEAVEILERADVVCPARFEWWGKGGWWRAQVNRERSWFIQKRTGEQALIVTAIKSGGAQGHPDSFRDWEVAVVADCHITLTEEGLTVHRRPGEKEPRPDPDPDDKPTPSRSDEPTDPELHDLLDEVRAWAMRPDVPKGRDRFRAAILERMAGIRGVAK